MPNPRTRTFGFLKDLHRYVAAADIVVTKPGALSTYEALACKVPVLFAGLHCLMPQESGLFEAAEHYDFGFAARTFDELAAIIQTGAKEWHHKRESISRFYESASAGELMEKIQPAREAQARAERKPDRAQPEEKRAASRREAQERQRAASEDV